MLNSKTLGLPEDLRAVINANYRSDEKVVLEFLLQKAKLKEKQEEATRDTALKLVKCVRAGRKNSTGIDSFLNEYSLSSKEGIALMCLAEALLRVPDNKTIDDLIKDKLGTADWKSHKGKSSSFFVNATTWALMLTGRVLSPAKAESELSRALMKLVNRSSESVLRKAVNKAMRIMSKQFVMGRDITEALKRAKDLEEKGFRYSYDMLGEAALTDIDAKRYFRAYKDAIEKIGNNKAKHANVYTSAGISVKLSALHPKYHETNRENVIDELVPILLELCKVAKKYDIGLTIDAEESERLDLSLDVIEKVFMASALDGWHGFGLAVQSYQKRAFYVLDWVHALGKRANRRINVRLIKGAYWDSEIKKAQILGLSGYPVFTKKVFTDVSFQACTKKILTLTDFIYPQFATHNAYSVALVLNLVGDYRDFEFQCLHGMGVDLYKEIVPRDKYNIPARIYAPVGSHEDLLPYLVRRLLENGANSSFVNRIVDDKLPLESLVEDPVLVAEGLLGQINKNIPLPKDIFYPRINSKGIDLTDREFIAKLEKYYADNKFTLESKPIIAGKKYALNDGKNIYAPYDNELCIGKATKASVDDMDLALTKAHDAFGAWSLLSASERADILNKFADLLEKNMYRLLFILCKEAGKTWNDSIAEVREAVDFCRYYAREAVKLMGEPVVLHGYTGEYDELSYHPRGVAVCISPWNFPLAIFTGQIVANLAVGNTVIAKPSEQTTIIAYEAVKLMLEAGVSDGAIQLVPGSGAKIGSKILPDERVKVVVFTGSTATASIINKTLAEREGEIIPLIAETGGQNAMIVDSSALLEQVTQDVLLSAFGSAGQRCSALRVLYVQDEVADRLFELLKGAMARLDVGNPELLVTDVGPVIDAAAKKSLEEHITDITETHKILYQCEAKSQNGFFVYPIAIEIQSIKDLSKENFGPILHLVRFKRKDLDKVIADINSTGYGLTFGIHSRISSTVDYIRSKIKVGNCYVNRNMTGAVVGLQPFGGEGLSGTGPKAGGPNYLTRLCHERTFTVDTTAAGGNASLMLLD